MKSEEPVCIEVRTENDLGLTLGHLRDAAERVKGGEHHVRRPNDHFIGRIKRGYSNPDF